ncbi:MAG: hypothetical protein CM15mP128_1840 [Methanobacteriota archaeon]|nr:MAG: hypothetical protein CM15mP128_1840 [Euryarchaeota archaeon]
MALSVASRWASAPLGWDVMNASTPHLRAQRPRFAPSRLSSTRWTSEGAELLLAAAGQTLDDAHLTGFDLTVHAAPSHLPGGSASTPVTVHGAVPA